MIKKIYSKLNPKELLSIVYFSQPTTEHIDSIKRHEITEPEHFLQAIMYEIPAETTIKPHKHNPQERKTSHTHESLLILKGSVELFIYDTDKKLVEKTVLKKGDCSVIISGGHSFKTITKAEVFEFKNGPFTGSDKDRTYF